MDNSARVKFIAWDDNLKRKVEVDQDLVIKLGLRPMTYYFYLVAKLNTDMKNNIISDDYVVEYLQFSDQVNAEFADAINEMGNFTNILISKVVKKGDSGKDFSYLKPTPSNLALDPSLLKKIAEVTSNTTAVDMMWQIIDRSTSITADEYIKLLNEEAAKSGKAIESGTPFGERAQTPTKEQFNKNLLKDLLQSKFLLI